MKISFIGDINFRSFDELTVEQSRVILSEINQELCDSDYRVANLETPLADKEKHEPISKSGPNHIYSPKCISFLEVLKTDVATLANNHMGDYGDGALLETIALLDAHNIAHVGAGANIIEAYKGVRLVKDETSVSIIAVCENEFGIATEAKCGAAGYNTRRLWSAIQSERKGSDFVIVVFHGGNEFNPLPSPCVVDRYRMFCDMGADAVIATHTHCPQGYEIYDEKPIVYSMGNFMFQSGTPRDKNDSWYFGYASALDLAKGEKPRLTITPYHFDTTAKIKVLKGEEKEKKTAYLEKISAIISDEDLLRKYYMGWCCNHQWYPKIPESYDGQKGKLNGAYNLLSCEAHAEMVKENYRILNSGDEEIAKEYAQKIKALAIIPV